MVAAEAGVSKTTVSFVLNNNPTISEKTRRKVLEIVQRLGYQPNVNARNLSSRRTRAICVLVPELGHVFEDPYFSRALSGVYDELEAADHRMVLRKVSYEFAKEKEYINLFRRAEAAGMLYIGSTLDDTYLGDFVEAGYPFVLVNSYLPGVSLPCVLSDMTQAGLLATRHLLELGHRRIAHVAGSPNTTTARDRGRGYRKALKEAGVEYDSALEICDSYAREDARAAVKALLARDPSVTALFAANDMMALGAIEAARECGRRVPEDISVVGGDSVDLSQFTSPPLTSIDLAVFDVARESVRLLFDLIQRKTPSRGSKVVLEPRLVVRSSSAPPPAREVVSA